MLKKQIKKTPLLLALMICGLSPVIHAEETAQDFTLETIVVTGSKIAQEGETTKVTTINVEAGKVNSITELLENVVPGLVIEASHPGYGSINLSMRGMDNDRLLVAINGNVIADQGEACGLRSFDWRSIPVNNIKKIEIIRGASSAVYGGTWGGVINILLWITLVKIKAL